jgi:GxxExxY protein
MVSNRYRLRAKDRLDDATAELATSVIGAAIEVHGHLGPGLPESVYRKSMCVELTRRGIAFLEEAPVPVIYKGVLVGKGKMDILVAGRLVVELKVAETLSDVHVAQCLAYLSATGLQLAILINFNVAVLKDGLQRVVETRRSMDHASTRRGEPDEF